MTNAETTDNPRTVHSGSGVGIVLYQDNAHLHGPPGLVLASNGHLITANGDAVNAGGTPSALVEFTLQGKFVAQVQLDMGASSCLAGANAPEPSARRVLGLCFVPLYRQQPRRALQFMFWLPKQVLALRL